MSNKLKMLKNSSYILLSTTLILLFFICNSLHLGLNKYSHTIIESFSFFSAILTSILAFIHYYNKKENLVLFLAVGFLGAGIFDLNHVLFTLPFHVIKFNSSFEVIFQLSGGMSRLFLALFLCFSIFGWKREQKLGKSGLFKENIVYDIAVLSVIIVFLILTFIHLPSGNSFEFITLKGEHFIPCFIFFLALILYFQKNYKDKNNLDFWIIISLIANIFSTSLMLFSKHLFDSYFVISHYLKLFSYDFVLIGFLISVYLTFKLRRVKKH